MSFRFASLQIRTFLAFGTFLALCIAGGGWAANRALAAALQERFEAQQEALVALLARSLDDKIATYLAGLEASAGECPTHPGGPGPWLAERASLRSMFKGGTYLVGPDGTPLAVNAPGIPPSGLQAEAGAFFRKVATRGRTGISSPFRLPGSEPAVVVMAAPVHGPSGSVRGLVVGLVPLDPAAFQGSLVHSRLPGGGSLRLLDAQGHSLLESGPPPTTAAASAPLLTRVGLVRAPWQLEAQTPEAFIQAPAIHMRHALQAATAAAVAVALALSWLLSHRLTRNLEVFIRQVEDAADRPPGQRMIQAQGHDETRQLVEAFNGLMARLDRKAAQLLQAKIHHEEELALAKHVLHRLVEPGLAALPSGFHMETLRTERINGDACTYREGAAGLHFGLVCDATGHGLTAGISTLPAIQAFLSMVSRDIPLETVYREINLRIHQLMPVGRFLCLLLVRLDLRYRTLSVLNAGLPDAFLGGPDATPRRFPSRNLPAGILAGGELPEVETVAVEPGSRFLAFTDGVLDLFPGEEAERRLFRGLEATPFGTHRAAIEQTLALAIGNQEQHDDVSWALWEVPAAPEVAIPGPPKEAGVVLADRDEPLALSLVFSPRTCAVRDLVPEVVRLLAARGLGGPLEQALSLALSEVLAHAVDHGLLRLDPALRRLGFETYEALRRLHLAALQEGHIRLEVTLRALPSGPIRELVVAVEDSGPGFDWRAWERDDPSLAAGRGPGLIRTLATDVTFNEAGNRIRFILGGAARTPGSAG